MTYQHSIRKPYISELAELDKKHYLHPTTVPKLHVENGPKLTFSEGEGIYVKCLNGESYIDGLSMLWNVNIGHGNKELAETAKAQMSKLAFSSSFAGFSNEPAVHLAEKLSTMAPGDLNSVFFTSGGSESNDTAFKLARFYWKLQGLPDKRKIIALKQSYHGVTIGAQTATAIPAFHLFSGSGMTEVFHATAHVTNCELGDKSDPNYKGCIRDIVEREGADTIAAIIMEPVQGSGGVHMPPDGYLQAVRKLCDEFNILFIADEVICGFGRTGEMFGVDNWGVVPDLMCVAKGISSGYSQLGGVLLKEKIHDTIVQYDEVLAHGFTYSGHPTACAVALKNIEILERNQVVENVKDMEIVLEDGFNYLKEKHPTVTKSRALGLLSAFELYADREEGIPFDQSILSATEVVEECFKRKLILRPLVSNVGRNIVAIAPPLIINKQQVEEIISILDDAISVFEKKYL
ncbi:aspartate aminotransferase family protein [Alkalihalophilus lindianensis]|uniref:Aspartate aminotransferase family protein n=1 Tax=Alkalihalophilus lindianensis TaxID=1630542 RepID=A0ABU3X9F9_9BACI|nr:aspartate aminotransferase family protein [Alkalihalophilus lindianensis]MDV2684089.1 aspartate aminotransferase family protein [Alkalihalophilus lindianensis]